MIFAVNFWMFFDFLWILWFLLKSKNFVLLDFVDFVIFTEVKRKEIPLVLLDFVIFTEVKSKEDHWVSWDLVLKFCQIVRCVFLMVIAVGIKVWKLFVFWFLWPKHNMIMRCDKNNQSKDFWGRRKRPMLCSVWMQRWWVNSSDRYLFNVSYQCSGW